MFDVFNDSDFSSLVGDQNSTPTVVDPGMTSGSSGSYGITLDDIVKTIGKVGGAVNSVGSAIGSFGKSVSSTVKSAQAALSGTPQSSSNTGVLLIGAVAVLLLL